MKLNKIFIAGAMASMLAMTTSCRDDYQDLNIDPSNVAETMPDGILAAAINKFQPTGYQLWFYNTPYYTRWDQMGTPSGGFSNDFTGMKESGDQGTQYLQTLRLHNRLQSHINSGAGSEADNGYLAATGIMTIYLGIFDTDVYGSIPYTEACHYDDLGILTPKYDTVEELYDTWINELNSYITMLQAGGLNTNINQDAAYGCDWAKWAKLANSLKLKIAVRLLANDKSKALQIANEAASNSAGLITSTDDDFLFCKATSMNSGDNDVVYGTGNGLSTVYATQNVFKFMLGSKDPRIRFIYAKNDFNSQVVQSFIDNGAYDKLPSQVKENVVLDENGNFKEWGGMGEPWVRYTALPVQFEPKNAHNKGAISDEEYEEYWNSGIRYQIKIGDNSKSYNPFCYYSDEMRRGRVDFTLPTAMTQDASGSVNMNIIQDTEDCPLYQMYLGAGEINLYLAELALLNGGSFNGKSAEEWYKAGVKASVEEFDQLAKSNKIPYYGTTYNYDPNEKAIDLQDGEIDAMLATDNVKLTGTTADKLEKVYLQLLIHFSEQPDDQFVTARRSGYPKVGSSLLPFVKFDEVALSAIPRRFVQTSPDKTNVMKSIIDAAFAAQGFTQLGTNSQGAQYNSGNAPLNTERVWQDKGAPQWGTPNQ